MKVRFQIVDSILDEVESIQRRIAERAEKLFHERASRRQLLSPISGEKGPLTVMTVSLSGNSTRLA